MSIQTASVGPGASSRFASGCLIVFGLIFAGFGLLALVQGLRAPTLLNPALLIGALFTLIGLAVAGGALYGAKVMKRTEALKAEHPDKPWMWRQDWATGVIPDSNKSSTVGFWIFTLIWCAVSFPIAWKLTPQLSRENLVVLVVYLFPLVGIFMMIAAIYQTLRSMKFGTSILHLERVPVTPGRRFRGDIELHTDAVPASGYRLRILLVRAVTTRTGKNRSTTESLIWDSEVLVDPNAAMRSPMGTRVPFEFATPPDAHPCDDSDYYDRYIWRLTASAELPGVDYAAQFALPVFSTGEVVDGSEFAAFEQRHRVEAARRPIPPSSGVEIVPLPNGGEEFRVHAVKTLGDVIKSVLILGIWNAGIYATFYFHAPWGFPAVLIAIDVLLILATIDYYLGRSTIEVDKNGVRARRRWLGIGPAPSEYPSSTIDSIDGSTAGPESKVFGVTLKRREDRDRILVSSLRDRESADAVAARMMSNLGRQ